MTTCSDLQLCIYPWWIDLVQLLISPDCVRIDCLQRYDSVRCLVKSRRMRGRRRMRRIRERMGRRWGRVRG